MTYGVSMAAYTIKHVAAAKAQRNNGVYVIIASANVAYQRGV